MIKINIQRFGGRGANSGYGQGVSTGEMAAVYQPFMTKPRNIKV